MKILRLLLSSLVFGGSLLILGPSAQSAPASDAPGRPSPMVSRFAGTISITGRTIRGFGTFTPLLFTASGRWSLAGTLVGVGAKACAVTPAVGVGHLQLSSRPTTPTRGSAAPTVRAWGFALTCSTRTMSITAVNPAGAGVMEVALRLAGQPGHLQAAGVAVGFQDPDP